MAWWKGDDKSHTNPKLRMAECEGAGLHFFAISWSASTETDGKVPAHVVPMLSPELSAKRRAAVVKRLVDAGLWHEIKEGYQINDYLKYNPSHAQLEARREQERQRLAARRGAT